MQSKINILTLINAFIEATVLNSTHEIGENHQLNSLDVHADGSQSTMNSRVQKSHEHRSLIKFS